MLIKVLLFIFLIFLQSCFFGPDLGSKDNPVKLYFTPSLDSAVISANSQKLVTFLEKETGLFFKTGIPTNYISVVEAFGSKRADIGIMNSFGYLLAHKKYGAVAKLKIIRHESEFYQGQIITHVDSGIKNIQDLEGKKIAFTDSSSASGYMFALKILKQNQITPSNTIFALKHDNVVTMVYQKQVDAGATFYSSPSKTGLIRDARILVKSQFPDVEEKIKILALTEKIPNDPFVFRKDLPINISNKFIVAIKKYLQTPDGLEVFKNIYQITGVVDANDSDYEVLRQLIRSINLDLSKLVN